MCKTKAAHPARGTGRQVGHINRESKAHTNHPCGGYKKNLECSLTSYLPHDTRLTRSRCPLRAFPRCSLAAEGNEKELQLIFGSTEQQYAIAPAKREVI